MPRRSSNVQLRGSVWWFRLRVPDALRKSEGKGEITKSLHTSDVREAQQLARLERLKIEARWAAERRKLAPVLKDNLSEQELWHLASKWFVEAECRDEEKTKAERWETLDDAELDLAMGSEEHNLAPFVYREAEELLASEGIRLEPGSNGRMRLENLLRGAVAEVDRRKLRRAFPTIIVSSDPQFADLNAASILNPVAKTTVAQLIKQYDGDATRPPMSRKTKLKRDAQWQAIKEFFGADIGIDQIGRDRVREFMSLLQKLPSNATKHFPNATIFEAAALGTEKGLPVLAVDTANDYLRTLGALFRFAVDEGKLAKDPSAGLLIRAEKKIRAKDKRFPFSDADLKAIFTAPLYTGCKDDEAGYAVPGSKIVRRGRFWVPLIALFTGMRLNEICQLSLDDFEVQDGAEIILIRGSDDGETKRVETEAGHRFVPIHPELKQMGLQAFVSDRRSEDKADAPLFPELPLGTTGYRSDPFSKFYSRFLDKLGITDPKKVFHSFRYNYRDALREADISIEKVRALGGWTTGNTEDDYGKGLRASTLAEAIKTVQYPGLDLSHLYVATDHPPTEPANFETGFKVFPPASANSAQPV